MTSMVKRVDLAVYETIKDVFEGKFEAGVRSFGVADGGVGTSPFTFTKHIVLSLRTGSSRRCKSKDYLW